MLNIAFYPPGSRLERRHHRLRPHAGADQLGLCGQRALALRPGRGIPSQGSVLLVH